MAAPIQKLAKASAKIFGCRSNEVITKESLHPIAQILNEIKADDLDFRAADIVERDASLKKRGRVAPVTFMNLCHHKDFTLTVFIVKAGYSLPLHDHPRMFGMLKVIAGAVKITSYSKVDEVGLQENDRPRRSFTVQTMSRPQTPHNAIPVYKNDDLVLSDSDRCCILTPDDGNFHEINSLSEVGAFLDILAPPYGSDNDCHYYKEFVVDSVMNTNLRWLIEVPQPFTYWCDVIKYRGPSLDSFDVVPEDEK